MHSPVLKVALVAFASALAAAACSGSDEPDAALQDPPPTTTRAPAITPPPPATTDAPAPPPPRPTTAAPTTEAPASSTTAPPATTGPPTTQPPHEGTIITIGDLFFRPGTITVSVGETVVWQNGGDLPHTTTAGTPGARSDDWHSGTMSGGDSFSVTFDSPGTFPYFCSIHPNDMQATITVTDG